MADNTILPANGAGSVPPAHTLPLLKPNHERIPDELKRWPHWALWRAEPRDDGRIAKVPYTPEVTRASVSDPRTWVRYEHAIECYTRGGFDGVGVMLGWAARGATFVMPPHLSGLDYDRCIDPATGLIRDESVRDALALLQTYAELSPSGTGVKVLVFGSLPSGQRRSARIEMYDESRFFTVTGHWLKETPWQVHERQHVLGLLHAHYFGGCA